MKDCSGRYCWVNRAFVAGASLERPPGEPLLDSVDFLGKTDYDLSPAFLADQFRLDDEQVLTGKRIVNRIELVGQADGTAVWNITNKIALRNAEGTIIGTAGITRRLNTPGQEIAPGSEFGPVLAYMRDHYHGSRSPISNWHAWRMYPCRTFERRFRASFCLTPQRYLRELATAVATRSLIDSRLSLADVALSCGFADQSHFSREFRRHFGCTPRAYRDRYLQATDTDASGTISAAGDIIGRGPAVIIKAFAGSR